MDNTSIETGGGILTAPAPAVQPPAGGEVPGTHTPVAPDAAKPGNGSPSVPADQKVVRYALPDEFKAMPTFKKFMDEQGTVDPAVVLKSYAILESAQGREKIPVPKTDEEFGKVYDILGRPEAPERYELTRPEMPANMPYDEEGEKFLRQFGHQQGWNQKQMAAAYDTLFKRSLESYSAWDARQKESAEAAEAALRREFGNAYDGYVNQAKATFRQYADPEFAAWVDQNGLSSDPRFIRVFGKVGKEMMGDSERPGGMPPLEQTPADLDAAISEYRNKHGAALFDKDHPEHAMHTERYNALFDKRYGTKPVSQ